LQSIILFIYYYTQKTRQLSIAVCKKNMQKMHKLSAKNTRGQRKNR